MSSSKLSFSTIILKVRKQSVRKNSSFFPTLPALVSLTPYLSLPYLGSGRIVTYPDIPSYMVKYPTIHSPPKPHRHKNEKKNCHISGNPKSQIIRIPGRPLQRPPTWGQDSAQNVQERETWNIPHIWGSPQKSIRNQSWGSPQSAN